METTRDHVETVVVGGGQAGLATAYHLQRRGRACVVLESNQRIGDGWRRLWDSLRLYSPARYDGLPGLPFPAGRWTCPGKDAVADYLEQYAAHHGLPVRLGVRVERVTREGDRFVVRTSEGTTTCDNLVVATGTFGRTPNVPELAAGLDPSILQLHSSEYRRPGQLADGPVLVVGASHSGCDIAHELAATRTTVLAGRDCGQIPFPIESRRARLFWPLMAFAWRHVLTRRTPVGRREMAHIRFHGGPMLRVRRNHLAERGVDRREHRVTGVEGGRPVLADGSVLDVATVVWCTGYRQDFGWLDLPVVGEDGWPRELRGVAEDVPGLYFCGLSFQSSFSSMVLLGAGRDADHVAGHLDARMRHAARPRVTAPAQRAA
jgi:putative flavoprotein involved in K+ transport